SLPLRRVVKRPLRGLPDGPAPAWILRTTAGIRVGNWVITASSANRRRGRSEPLRDRFSFFADHAAQGRPDPTATAPAALIHLNKVARIRVASGLPGAIAGTAHGAALFAFAFRAAGFGHGSYLPFAVFGAPLSLLHGMVLIGGPVIVWPVF